MTNSELNAKIKALDKPGREKFIQLCKQLNIQYVEPENDKLAYDCYIIYKGKKYIIELKDRDTKYEHYDEYILEQDKYERVMAWKERLGAAGAYYCNWFGNKAYLFNLEDPRITEHPAKQWMNAITAKSRNEKVEKEIFYINKSIATVYII
jgi:hypothetical protein